MSINEEYVKVYSNTRNFRDKVKTKYKVPNRLLFDDKILLMIYAYEWFKIPKSNNFERVSYHPFLVQKDLDLVNHICSKYIYLTLMPTLLLFIGGLGIVAKRNKKKAGRLLFGIINMITTNILGYCLWKYYFYHKLNEEVGNDPELNQYLELNVDINTIINELRNNNITLV